MNTQEKLTYAAPEAMSVEFQPGATLLQGSAIKQDYQDGGDLEWITP